MRYQIHKSEERGRVDYGWLATRYSFSFAEWFDPNKMGFGKLRVLNDDTITPHTGFPMHSHKDMEIVTIVTSGAVAHKDSLGNTGVVRAGDVQVLSAGTGVTHSEWNDGDVPLTLFQIWIETGKRGVEPRYEQKAFDPKFRQGTWQEIVSGKSREGELWITQDAHISLGSFEKGTTFSYSLHDSSYGLYLFIITGLVEFEKNSLAARDGVAITGAVSPAATSLSRSEVVAIEVPLK